MVAIPLAGLGFLSPIVWASFRGFAASRAPLTGAERDEFMRSREAAKIGGKGDMDQTGSPGRFAPLPFV